MDKANSEQTEELSKMQKPILEQGKEGPRSTRRKDRIREYRCWLAMRNRCYNPKSDSYANYWGRGISVCQSWRESFDCFYLDMGARPNGTSIDRIDNDGNYEPKNCRWATPREQCNNKRTNVKITERGTTYTIAEWARLLNRSTMQIQTALLAGRSIIEPIKRCAMCSTGISYGERCWSCKSLRANRRNQFKREMTGMLKT